MLFQRKIFFLSLAILLMYTSIHYVTTGILFSYHRNPIHGDLAANWPTKWAWRLNPVLIEQNPSAQGWLGDKTSKKWGYGPVLHYVLFPFLFFKDFTTASHAWLLVCHLLLCASLLIWYKILFVDTKLHSNTSFIIYLAVWLNFFPLYEGLTTRNIEILELFFLSLVFYFIKKNKDNLAGISLGLATMTKFLPAIFFPYFLLKRRYTLAVYCLMTIVAIAISAQFSLGWKDNWVLMQLRAIGHGLTFHESQSISSWIYRLYADTPTISNMRTYYYAKVGNPEMVHKIVKTILLSLMCFYGIFFLLKRKNIITSFEVAILCILMITVIQHNHIYYLLFLLVPFSLFLQYLFRYKGKVGSLKKEIGIFIASYLLTGLFVPLSILSKIFDELSLPRFVIVFQFYSFPVYGYLILLIYFTVKEIKNGVTQL